MANILNLALLTNSIKGHEGFRSKPYVDATGNITIAWGRNLTANGISTSEGELLLSNDIANAITASQGEAWWPHVSGNDERARAMVEIVFNIGVAGVRGFVVAIAALLRDDFNASADAFLDSRWATQVGDRATILTDMIRGWDNLS